MDVFILKLSTERWNLRMESFRLNRLILIYLYYSWLHLYKEKRGTGQRPSRLNRCQKSILYAFFFPFSSRLFFYFSPGLPKWRGDVSISRFLWFYNLRVSWCYIFATWTRNCPGFQGPKTRLRKKWSENCLSLQVRKIKKNMNYWSQKYYLSPSNGEKRVTRSWASRGFVSALPFPTICRSWDKSLSYLFTGFPHWPKPSPFHCGGFMVPNVSSLPGSCQNQI